MFSHKQFPILEQPKNIVMCNFSPLIQPLLIHRNQTYSKHVVINNPDEYNLLHQKGYTKIRTLDDIRVTNTDKNKIKKIIQNSDHNWKQSNFVDFLQKVQQKESILNSLEDQSSKWADEYKKLKQNEPEWLNQLEDLRQNEIDWEKELDVDWASYKDDLNNMTKKNPKYMFQEQNPYENLIDPFEKGLELMKNGNLSEAVKAFEVACKQNPSRAIAWRYLGKCSADNENEKNAIAAYLKLT